MAHPEFPLPIGYELPEGTIVGMSFTAYKVETAAGDDVFVPFVRVHPPVPVAGLVAFDDGSVYDSGPLS